jgi:hypothetical protein
MNFKKGSDPRAKLTYKLIIAVFLLVLLTSTLPFSSAMNEWMENELLGHKSTVLKTVDPIFINYPTSDIQIPVGESWSFTYNLKSYKKYHIFLVGDWIVNDTDPVTDYDIYTYKPSGTLYTTHTESAGLPEQVANDAQHQYFSPDTSGDYTFKIVNDERDSKNFEPAIFMIIEHIDVNTEFTQLLEGRDIVDDPVLYTSWSYEFNTSSPTIRVFVDVPSNLDMYEARLYAMANPGDEVGYNMYGVGVPRGEFFEDFSGLYGGFNTSSKGDRNILAYDSGEYKGQDLEFIYDTPNKANETYQIFYYLVLIAEHGYDSVDFIVQTDFVTPEVTLVNPPELGIEGDMVEIQARAYDETGIEKVWVEYTDDSWITSFEESMHKRESVYSGYLPNFLALDYIEYKVIAQDIFGNEGFDNSSFGVKRASTVEVEVLDDTLLGSQKAVINGKSSLVNGQLSFLFNNSDYSEEVEVETDEFGGFNMEYSPHILGEWSVQAFFDGSDAELPTESNVVYFDVSSIDTKIIASLDFVRVKKNQPVRISGAVSPNVGGLPVEVMLVSASGSVVEKVSTRSDGSYVFSKVLDEVGIWNGLAKVGDGFEYVKSSSDLMEFEVLKLTIIDKLVILAFKLVSPPFLYGTIGFIGIGLSSVLYIKREALGSLLPKGLGKKSGKKKVKNGKKAQRYRRNRR